MVFIIAIFWLMEFNQKIAGRKIFLGVHSGFDLAAGPAAGAGA